MGDGNFTTVREGGNLQKHNIEVNSFIPLANETKLDNRLFYFPFAHLFDVKYLPRLVGILLCKLMSNAIAIPDITIWHIMFL